MLRRMIHLVVLFALAGALGAREARAVTISVTRDVVNMSLAMWDQSPSSLGGEEWSYSADYVGPGIGGYKIYGEHSLGRPYPWDENLYWYAYCETRSLPTDFQIHGNVHFHDGLEYFQNNITTSITWELTFDVIGSGGVIDLYTVGYGGVSSLVLVDTTAARIYGVPHGIDTVDLFSGHRYALTLVSAISGNYDDEFGAVAMFGPGGDADVKIVRAVPEAPTYLCMLGALLCIPIAFSRRKNRKI